MSATPRDDELMKNVWECDRRIAELLGVSVVRADRDRPELRRDGTLLLPYELCLVPQETRVYRDARNGRMVAIGKVIICQFQNFDHKIFRGDRRKVAVLCGRDETGGLWMHVLPDRFMDRTLAECDRYLYHRDGVVGQ
jgi:hypothetical protein